MIQGCCIPPNEPSILIHAHHLSVLRYKLVAELVGVWVAALGVHAEADATESAREAGKTGNSRDQTWRRATSNYLLFVARVPRGLFFLPHQRSRRRCGVPGAETGLGFLMRSGSAARVIARSRRENGSADQEVEPIVQEKRLVYEFIKSERRKKLFNRNQNNNQRSRAN